MNVLVTGGAGFVGSHITDRLIARGATVSVVDDLSTGKLSNLDSARREGGVRFHRFDITSDGFNRVLARENPDVVIHMAAQSSVAVSTADPVRDAVVNVAGLVNVLEACVASNVSRIVFAQSGGTIYGEHDALPVKETAKMKPASPYAISKRAAEDYLRYYNAQHGITFASLALGNVYGPRQDPHGEAGVVSIFAETLLRGLTPTIFGDGSVTRDYVFVDDVAHAFVVASEKASADSLNIGTGIETNVSRIYELVSAAVGDDRPPKWGDPRAGDIPRISLDASRAARVLGWAPWTTIEEGIRATVFWLRAELRARGVIE